MSDLESDEVLYGKQMHPMTSSVPGLRASAVSFSSTFSPDSFVEDAYDEQFLDENDDAIWMEGDFDADANDEVDQKESPGGMPENVSKPRLKISYFWRRRMAEAFIIQLVLLASITLFTQSSNRLSMTSATIVSGSEARTLTPWKNSSTLMNNEIMIDSVEDEVEDCIYVPGGGFSGFWFSLGRLHSIQNPHNETFVCYSAGCLGVVATLLHHGELLKNGGVVDGANDEHYHHLYDMARSIQIEWDAGKLHRYRVVESFIDGLVEKLEQDPDDEFKTLFLDTIRTNMNVVTTTYENDEDSANVPQLLPQSILPKAVVRRPSDLASLKRMLLQSAWIPIATGSSWTHKGHFDGAFSTPQHPKCSRTVGLDASASTIATEDASDSTSAWLKNQIVLLGNALNVNLGREQVGELWKLGMERGV